MKKLNIILTTLLFLVLSTGSAFALSFHWDLTGTGTSAAGFPVVENSGNAVNFPNDMTTSGTSTITQTLTGGADDNVLDDGDTFTEFGGLNVIGSGGHPGDYPFTLSGNHKISYIHYTGLSGVVAGHDDGGSPTTDAATFTDDTFSLNFTPGVGTIEIYLDDNLDPTDGGETLKVAELELLAGIGTQPQFILSQPEGQFGIVAGFTWVLDDFWNTELFGDAGSEDFADVMTAIGSFPSIIAASFNLGATLEAGTLTNVADGIEFTVVNEGSFELSVVPEPTTMLLFGFGLLGIAGITRRKTA